MDKYPFLKAVKRHGAVLPLVLALIAALASGGLAWTIAGWGAVVLAAVVAIVVFALVKCFVELITLITDVLMPE